MEAQKGSERRKYSRLATDQVISFAPLESRDLLGVSRDLSLGGIRFEAVGCEIDLGDVLRVTFNVGEDTVVAVGKVAWSTEVDPITLDVGLEFHRVVTLNQWIKKLMDSDGLTAVVALAEVVTFQHACDRAAGGQLDHVGTGLVAHPFRIEHHLGFFVIEDLEDLLLVGFSVFVDLGLGHWRTGRAFTGRITDHAGKVADQKQYLVPEVLELLELVDQHGMTDMQIGGCRVKSRLDSQWTTQLQLVDELFFDKYLIRAAADNI